MQPFPSTVKISEDGHLTFPAEHLRLLNLERGGTVVLRVESGEIRLRPLKTVIAELQAAAMASISPHPSHTDLFLAERREEAARDPLRNPPPES